MSGLYSFGRMKVISRNGIKSSVATAAYHAALEIKNEYDGVTHDYSKKKNVGETFIRLPDGSPTDWSDESMPAKERVKKIWNDIEQIHTQSNARLARSNYICIPHELNHQQGLDCVERFIKENCTNVGMGAIFTEHNMPENRHVDVMYFASRYDENKKLILKSQKEYLCRNKTGEEVYMTAAAFKCSEGYEKVYRYKKDDDIIQMTKSEAEKVEGWERVNKSPCSRKRKVSGWDEPGLTKKWRKSWEVILNEKFEELGIGTHVDCRSYKERGLTRKPTIHEGHGHEQKERKEYNQQIKNFNQELESLYNEGVGTIRNIEEQIIDLQDNSQTEDSINNHEEKYEMNKRKLNAIVESDLFSCSITHNFKAKLNELSKWMNKWLTLYRKKIKELYGANTRVTELSKQTQQATGEAKQTLKDILAEATKKVAEQNASRGKKRTKNQIRDDGPKH